MKALSIKQPYSQLICEGIKDIENRSFKTHFRGSIYIHASMKWHDRLKTNSIYTKEQVSCILDNAKGVFEYRKYFTPKFREPLHVGAIIGQVDIVDCVINHESIWADKTPIVYKKPLLKDKNLRGYDEALKMYNENKPIWNWVLANPVIYEKPILNVKGKLSFWEFENNLIK